MKFCNLLNNMNKKNILTKSLKERWADGSFKGTTGRVMPAEERERRSKSLKGKIPKNLSLINENKKGPGNPMWGKKETDAHKKWRMRNTVGRKKSIEERKKISNSQKGEKGSNWKGGITSINKSIRHGIDFRLWREAVFARDNWTCKKCNIRGGIIHPHHIKNFAEYPELRFAIDNGISFCKDCHKKFHKIYGMTKNTIEQVKQYINKKI